MNQPSKYKVIKDEVHTLFLGDKMDVCEECNGLMVEYKDGLYSDFECKKCGNTQTTERTRPI